MVCRPWKWKIPLWRKLCGSGFYINKLPPRKHLIIISLWSYNCLVFPNYYDNMFALSICIFVAKGRNQDSFLLSVFQLNFVLLRLWFSSKSLQAVRRKNCINLQFLELRCVTLLFSLYFIVQRGITNARFCISKNNMYFSCRGGYDHWTYNLEVFLKVEDDCVVDRFQMWH